MKNRSFGPAGTSSLLPEIASRPYRCNVSDYAFHWARKHLYSELNRQCNRYCGD